MNYSPYELVFAKKPILPPSILSGKIDPIYNVDNYIKEAKYRLQKAHEKARLIIEKMKINSKSQYDKNSNPINIKIGEKVYLECKPYNKHEPIYTGPYEVISIEHPNVIIKIKENKTEIVHKNRLVKK